MPLFQISERGIEPVTRTTFQAAGIRERGNLQKLLLKNIDVVCPETLIIAEEFASWEGANRRIDLLGIDKNANLVVIELKRDDDGGHMDLQAIRYAAMVSTMTFDSAVEALSSHLQKLKEPETDVRRKMLDFLDWEEPDHNMFAKETRIVLVAADFSREITTTALWLNDREVDIRCVKIEPYNLGGTVIIDIQQVIPLPESIDYQVQIRERTRIERQQLRERNADRTKYDVTLGITTHSNLTKTSAIMQVCKYLCGRNINPNDIARLCGSRQNRVWFCVEGEVNSSTFISLANQKAQSQGKPFQPSRYYCDDEDLVKFQGRTYALSSSWGDPNWSESMTSIVNRFSDHEISFRPTGMDV